METETVQYVVCCCEALSSQRYVLGELIIEPKVYVQLQSETGVSSSETEGYLNCAEWSVLGMNNKPWAEVLLAEGA